MKNKRSTVNTLLCVGALMVLAACTPADISYCSKFGVEGTAEYGKCLVHYQQEEAAFGADHAVCAAEADETYPRTLYDRGGFAHVGIGSGWGGFHHGHRYGGGYGGGVVSVPPNYHHNAEVDRLRSRIIAPCMHARGWNSPNSWQAGRHEVKPMKRRAGRSAAAPAEKLPWLQ